MNQYWHSVAEKSIVERSIHFLIPALSADEPSHILSLPETFALQQHPLEGRHDDPNLFIHHEQSISKYYPSDSNYLSDYAWTSLPVCRTDSYMKIEPANEFIWRQVNLKKKSKVRHSRKRTKFSPEDLEILNLFFDQNPMPSRSDISILAERLAYPRYIVQVWFYNKRQSLKRANSSSSSSQLDGYPSGSLK